MADDGRPGAVPAVTEAVGGVGDVVGGGRDGVVRDGAGRRAAMTPIKEMPSPHATPTSATAATDPPVDDLPRLDEEAEKRKMVRRGLFHSEEALERQVGAGDVELTATGAGTGTGTLAVPAADGSGVGSSRSSSAASTPRVSFESGLRRSSGSSEWGRRSIDPLTASRRRGNSRSLERLRSTSFERAQMYTGELRRTGRFGGGLMADFKRRWPSYMDDWQEGWEWQCLSAVLLLFFAQLGPVIVFGGLFEQHTDGQVGLVEVMLSTALCGTFWALFGGQPMLLVGPTGPLLLFTEVLYQWSQSTGIDFVPLLSYTGLWCGLFCVLAALLDLSALIVHVTRFTDEIFAVLISLVFITEAIVDILSSFRDGTDRATALLDLLLALGTLFLATTLRDWRHTPYLRPLVRTVLADFGTVVAITLMTGVRMMMRDVDVENIRVVSNFDDTTSGRAWLVDLSAVPVWAPWFAVAPGFLLFLLVFLEQNIASRLINKPVYRMFKGSAHHWDLLATGVMIWICAIIGVPYTYGNVGGSLNHLQSLIIKRGDRIVDTIETRVTGFFIHVLLLASLLLLPVLSVIPMAVMLGMFINIGITSLGGNQLFARVKLLAMQRDAYPTTHFVRNVPIKKIHVFTGIQLIAVGTLWAVKSLLFWPVLLCVLIPLWKWMAPHLFTKRELEALDSEYSPDDDWNLEDMPR